ncbi:zinc finger protein ZAT5-like [Macadamia integrifolia]|uniref:zinc finger protein ZAT5-like n=1 Tax=Macadamia integrifolia TaxID=60698 RepID=UPI001C4F0417|nr:zinc finger protein ZAT5-like [Macadamia integrifolia]
MEAPPEEVLGSNDLTHIVKGKRTKRQRPPSPLAFTMNNTTSSSSAGGGSGIGGGGIGEDDYNYIPSPTTSSTELFAGEESTEQEEDMANCLILLAQGHGRENLKRIEERGSGAGGGGAMERSSSRRFTEAATTTTGKAGFYVYECKTCNRCFPSFQALGGHRASHKKPKAMVGVGEKENNKKASASVLMALSPDEDEAQFSINSPRPFPLQQMTSRAMYSNNTNNKSKVHECSICGSEFSSGQALGGHMRRHRSAAATTTTNNSGTTMMTTVTRASFELPEEEETHKPRNVLQLDLNLPAPSDEDLHHHHHRESKFSFASKQQQPPAPPPLVFSASPLVDCHY